MASTYTNISVYVTDLEALADIQRASKKAGMKRSAFMFQAATEAARKALKPKKRAA